MSVNDYQSSNDWQTGYYNNVIVQVHFAKLILISCRKCFLIVSNLLYIIVSYLVHAKYQLVFLASFYKLLTPDVCVIASL